LIVSEVVLQLPELACQSSIDIAFQSVLITYVLLADCERLIFVVMDVASWLELCKKFGQFRLQVL